MDIHGRIIEESITLFQICRPWWHNRRMAKDIHVKAVPVNGLYRFVEKELTPSQLEEVKSKLPEGERKWFTGHLLAHEQVPVSVVNRFNHLAAEAKGEPVKSFARRAGRFGAELGLKTVYKFVMMVMSTEAVLKKAPFMWTRVYDGGVMNVESGENWAKIHVTDFVSDLAVCGRITGWFEVIGEHAGAKDIRVLHAECLAEGGKECLWSFSWKK